MDSRNITQSNIRKLQKKRQILSYLEDGMNFRDACKLIGIDESTGHRWKQKDASFASQVEASFLVYKQKLITCVNLGAIKNPRIALEILRIRFPNEWNPSKKFMKIDPLVEIERIHKLIYQ